MRCKILKTIQKVCDILELLLKSGNTAEFLIFLEDMFSLVVGIEFIKMLAKHSPGSSLEVLLYAIARHMIVGHESAVENLLSVVAIGLIFAVRKYFFVPSFGSTLPGGKPAPDLVAQAAAENDSDSTDDPDNTFV